jgi:hypothetical protein
MVDYKLTFMFDFTEGFLFFQDLSATFPHKVRRKWRVIKFSVDDLTVLLQFFSRKHLLKKTFEYSCQMVCCQTKKDNLDKFWRV